MGGRIFHSFTARGWRPGEALRGDAAAASGVRILPHLSGFVGSDAEGVSCRPHRHDDVLVAASWESLKHTSSSSDGLVALPPIANDPQQQTRPGKTLDFFSKPRHKVDDTDEKNNAGYGRRTKAWTSLHKQVARSPWPLCNQPALLGSKDPASVLGRDTASAKVSRLWQ